MARRPTPWIVLLLALVVRLPVEPACASPVRDAIAQETEFRAFLPIALERAPVADQSRVADVASWRTWHFTATAETLIGTLSLRPESGRTSSLIAFAGGAAGSLERAAVQLRFKPDGWVDALDGDAYRAVEPLHYEPGMDYELRIVVNVPEQGFDAYVTAADGAPVLVARDFAFHAAAGPVEAIDQLGVQAVAGSLEVLRFVPEIHADYLRVTPKTVYGWLPEPAGAGTVVNASPTPGEGWYGTADIHPDGRDVIFSGAAWGYARIWRYTFATGKITALTPPSFVAVEPAYSADGHTIVFTSDKDLGLPRFDMFEVGRTRPHDDGFKGGYTRAANLYVMDADGRNLRQLTSGTDHVDMRGSFSPDGKTVVFLSSRGANTLYMWTVPADGSSPPSEVTLAGRPWVGRPRYAVDGREIYFFTGITDGAYAPYGRHTLCRVPVDGGTWSVLRNDTLGDGSHGPSPAPSGEKLWYHAFHDGLWGLYRLPLAGGAPARFVPPGFDRLHTAHATEAKNGIVAFDSRSYLETP